jgi:hypothetical protein
VDCLPDEPLHAVKKRLLDRARENLETLRKMPRDEFLKMHGPGGPHPYAWATTFFGDGWGEDKLEWLA